MQLRAASFGVSRLTISVREIHAEDRQNHNPTRDFARMLVWISDVPPMMVKVREFR
jgi:hypothetical protein